MDTRKRPKKSFRHCRKIFQIEVNTPEAFKLKSQIMCRMLMRIGMKVRLEVFAWPEYFRKLWGPVLKEPYEEQTWDIAIDTTPIPSSIPL